MRKLKCIYSIMPMAIALSSCGAIQQEKTDAVKTASPAASSETAEPSDIAPADNLSEEPEESTREAKLLDDMQSPGTAREEIGMRITLTIEDTSFTVQLEDNETAAALQERLPMTIIMDELHGNEKYFYLDDTLPTNSAVPDRIEAGDVMLFGSDCLVIFYESFSTAYSYTPVGHITEIEGLKDALGSGAVSVEWKMSS